METGVHIAVFAWCEPMYSVQLMEGDLNAYWCYLSLNFHTGH